MTFKHTSVLLNEAIEALNVKDGEKYIDATLGGAGHAAEIIKRGGLVLGIDKDSDALDFVCENQKEHIETKRLIVAQGNFLDIKRIAQENKFLDVSGVLFDLGVSSYQLDEGERGFSLKGEARLDMRMDRQQELSAYHVVNSYSKDKLQEIFYLYGEEANARQIAEAIHDARRKVPIATTKELSELIQTIPHKSEPIHPATRVFQAIRIEVNDELGSEKKGLQDAVDVLKVGGRIVVISFHSLEDRIAKQLFSKMERESKGRVITKRPVTASFDELNANKRARSAKLRVFEKTS